jgi:hypothetical protein
MCSHRHQVIPQQQKYYHHQKKQEKIIESHQWPSPESNGTVGLCSSPTAVESHARTTEPMIGMRMQAVSIPQVL